MAFIECRKLTREYVRGQSRVRPLDDLDLDVEAGTFLALMGPSGSGKTTLLNLIAGIDRPTSGSLLIDGTDIGQLSRSRLAAWRSEYVGYVFQLYNLLPEPADGTTVVAGDEELTGTASVSVRDGEAYLFSVAVREDARGLDVGTLVVAGAWSGARRYGARTGYLLTEEAEGFFARLGFEATDREALPAWIRERSTACSTSAVAMRRDVRS
jgi:N-acetylglutamate synthase-like GNAT family acetyltransferase